jgi:mRNA-degrading endonuclease RelE of RelBE toxin-antitoxin system
MPWRVDISRRGQRDLAQLSVEDQNAILAALLRLADDPSSVDFAKLGGRTNRWRLRVGRWRVILGSDNRTGVMTVARVLDRRDAYRG